MTRRKGEITSAQIDREYPLQIALPAEQVAGRNHDLILTACARLEAAPRTHSVRHDDRWYVVYCFPTDTAACGFQAIFGGEPFNPKDRGRGTQWFHWRKK